MLDLLKNLICMQCIVFALSGCAITDNVAPRVFNANVGSYDAANQETLLNIVRSSRYQALNFIALTQIAGSQTEDLRVGLPTLTLGPAQTAMQRQVTFGSNSLDSSVVGSFQSNPLVSSSFQEGLLSPMSLRTFALLASVSPRELLFHLVLDGIKATKDGNTYLYRNDPGDDLLDGVFQPATCEAMFGDPPQQPFPRIRFGRPGWDFKSDESCNYQKFMRLLRLAIQRGVTSELIPAPGGASGTIGAKGAVDGGDGKAIGSRSIGRVCFDLGLVPSGVKQDTAREDLLCGKGGTLRSDGAFNIGTLDGVRIDLVLRSPAAVYRYLGKILREGLSDRVRLTDPRSGVLNAYRFLNVDKEAGDCLVGTDSPDGFYCVPRRGSETTMAIFDVLQQLRNLSISPSDLNTAFTVRVAGQ